MKLFYFLLAFLIFGGCSFDNKSGIWKNENTATEKEKIIFKDFKKITSSNSKFDKIIPIDKKLILRIDKPIENKSWNDVFYDQSNNLKNFKFNNLHKVIFKSKKLSKYPLNKHILFDDNKLFVSDKDGNIIIYSINKRSIVEKINFYKKKYKGLEKNLNIVVEKNVIYTSDNIGYMYAYDFNTNKFLWAKNFKIPFRSNLKLSSNKLILANQNNDLLIINKYNGNLIKLIPTESTSINNKFINNIALSNKEILFFNTYGSLYSISLDQLKLNWFLNLNKNLDLNLSNLFFGSKIIFHDDKILVSNNENFFILDNKTGSILAKKNFSSFLKPLASNNYVFLITKNNFLISIKANTGEIIYSYDIVDKVAKFTNTKKRKLNINNIMLVNDQIFIFLKNSYIIKTNLKGEIQSTTKLSSGLNSHPIIIDNSLLYLDKRNKLFITN